MSYCYECGNEIVFEAQFCASCYEKVSKKTRLPLTLIHEVECPNCDEKMPCTAFVCRNCYQKITNGRENRKI